MVDSKECSVDDPWPQCTQSLCLDSYEGHDNDALGTITRLYKVIAVICCIVLSGLDSC